MKVLIVEDSPTSAKVISDVVKGLGYEFEIAETGKAAMEAIDRDTFHLLFIDNYLPDGQGHELIPRIKIMAPEMQIIAITGQNSDELERQTRSYGIMYYMIKPADRKFIEILITHTAKKLFEQ